LLNQDAITRLVGVNVFCGSVPQPAPDPCIWIARSGSEQAECLDDAPGEEPFRQFLDLECLSNRWETAQAISDAVSSLFPVDNGTTYGSAAIQGAWANSQDDSYTSRNASNGEFQHTSALSIEIVP
jgi:hypothetical protein